MVDGVVAAIKKAKGSTNGAKPGGAAREVQEGQDRLGRGVVLAEAALRLRPRLPDHRDHRQQGEVHRHGHGDVARQDLTLVEGVSESTTDAHARRPGGTLRAADVSRAFEGVQALQGVTLELHRHEVVGLIGPNGAGKSTLVNLLSGFDRPDLRPRRARGPRHHALERAAARPSRARTHVPARACVRRADGARERRGRRARRRRARAAWRGAAPPGCSTCSAWPRRPRCPRARSPTATSAGWASPGRSRPSRASC